MVVFPCLCIIDGKVYVMSAPILEKGPYIFNVNNAFNESTGENRCKRELLELKNALVNLGSAETIWKVIASCDGTTVWNINPLEEDRDLWDDIADVNHNLNSNPHSWCILKNLTTNGQLIIDYVRNTATTYPHYAAIRYSPGGTFTDTGTASDAPTAADAGTMWNQAYTFTDSAYYDTSYDVVINVMTSADHKITRWYNHTEYSNAWRGGTIGFIEEVQDTPAEWNSAIKVAVSSTSWNLQMQTYTPSAQSPQLTELDDGNVLYARYETAEPYAAWLSAYPGVECWGNISTNAGRGLYFNNVRQGPNNAYPVVPINLFRGGTTKGGYLGRLVDIYLTQDAHRNLDTYPKDGSRTWVKWGCFMVPWNGSAPLARL